MTLDYYKAPPDEVFNDIKAECIKIWQTYDDTYGYASEKINYIKPIGNVKDNCLLIVNMFDVHNMRRLINAVTKESQAWLMPYLEESFVAEAKLREMGIEL